MIVRTTIAIAVTTAARLVTSARAVTRGQESMGAYVDDTARRVNGVNAIENEIAVRP